MSEFQQTLTGISPWLEGRFGEEMGRNDDLDLVFARRGWLSDQTPALRRLVLERGRRVSFETGENIVHMGDAGGGIYGVILPPRSVSLDAVTMLPG